MGRDPVEGVGHACPCQNPQQGTGVPAIDTDGETADQGQHANERLSQCEVGLMPRDRDRWIKRHTERIGGRAPQRMRREPRMFRELFMEYDCISRDHDGRTAQQSKMCCAQLLQRRNDERQPENDAPEGDRCWQTRTERQRRKGYGREQEPGGNPVCPGYPNSQRPQAQQEEYGYTPPPSRPLT
jgi:hypothetical protein